MSYVMLAWLADSVGQDSLDWQASGEIQACTFMQNMGLAVNCAISIFKVKTSLFSAAV